MKKKIPLKLIVNSVSNEKGISENIIFDALEEAIICTTKKKYGIYNIITHINRSNGIYRTYIIYNVVEDYAKYPSKEIPLNRAKKENPDIKTGEIIKKKIKSINFGRIDAQIAKQIIIQRVKLAERTSIINEFIKKKGKLLSGIIKKINKENIIFDFNNNVEGILKKTDSIPKEILRPGDKIKSYFIDISKDNKGPELILSRTCNNMIIELFKLEIPEINEGTIEIKDIAREPGVRSKISVKTNDSRLDPIGTCIGIKGSRIQAISNELYNEKIDIILWDKDPIKYIINALSPAEIKSIEINNENKSMNITVIEDYLSRIIGKNGHNIKLISKLTHWKLNVISSKDIN